jgi:hypothetical protein
MFHPARSLRLAVHDVLAPSDADGELVRRMAAGDESALGTLYDRYSPLLHSVARRIVGDPEDAEKRPSGRRGGRRGDMRNRAVGSPPGW